MKSKSQIEKQVVKSYSDKEDGVLKLLLFWFSLDVLSSVNMNWLVAHGYMQMCCYITHMIPNTTRMHMHTHTRLKLTTLQYKHVHTLTQDTNDLGYWNIEKLLEPHTRYEQVCSFLMNQYRLSSTRGRHFKTSCTIFHTVTSCRDVHTFSIKWVYRFIRHSCNWIFINSNLKCTYAQTHTHTLLPFVFSCEGWKQYFFMIVNFVCKYVLFISWMTERCTVALTCCDSFLCFYLIWKITTE